MSARRGAPLEVLLVDNHLLVVDKPAGVPVAGDSSGDLSLLDQAKEWIAREFHKPGAVYLGLVHRLDRPVSGVVLLARTSKSAARLSGQFREHRVQKLYWGVGEGEPSALGGELVQWLVKDEIHNHVRVESAGAQEAQEASTRWRVLAQAGGQTLFEFQPLTGRPHQLRVAASSLGCPLLGDLKYGARVPLEDASVALHAHSLRFDHPIRGERLAVHSAAPQLACWDWAACRAEH